MNRRDLLKLGLMALLGAGADLKSEPDAGGIVIYSVTIWTREDGYEVSMVWSHPDEKPTTDKFFIRDGEVVDVAGGVSFGVLATPPTPTA